MVLLVWRTGSRYQVGVVMLRDCMCLSSPILKSFRGILARCFKGGL